MCFNGDEDFAAYAHWLKEFADKYEVEIHAWVFMTNHVHLSAIRTSVSKGLALGDNRFKLQIEENYKRRVTPRTAGRKPK